MTLGETTVQPKLVARLVGWGRGPANSQRRAKQARVWELRSLPGLGLAELKSVQAGPGKQRLAQKKLSRFYPALILRSVRSGACEVTAF